MMLNPTQVYDQKTKTALGAQNPFYLRHAKKAQPTLYDGDEFLKPNHVPVIVSTSEEELELAKVTRNKLHVKMNDSVCVEKMVNITPPNYSKENFMATFTPQTQLTPEQVFWSLDLAKRKAKELKANTTPLPVLPPTTMYPPNTPAHLVPRTLLTISQVNIGLYVITQLFWDFEKTCKKRITPTGITEGERGFEQTKRCYFTKVIPFFNLLKEHFEGIQKSLVTEVRAMKAVFENLEAEVDQNETDLRSGKIERKNLLITNENLVAECLTKFVFYTATDSVLNVSRFSEMHDAFTSAQKHIADLESENFNLRNKIQNDDHDSMIKHFSKLEVEHFNLQLKYQNLKERFGNKKPVTSSNAPSFDSLFVIGKLNDQIQSRGNTIHELKEKISRLTKKNSDTDPTFDLKALVSQNKDLTAKLNALHDLNECFRAENAKVKQHYKELYDSIKIMRAKTTDQNNSLLSEIEDLKAQLKDNSQRVTIPDSKPKVLAPSRYPIDVEPIPPRLKKNREVHLHYIKHLKENVETLREIVKDAKVERPLDTSLASACQPCETSTHNTPPQVEHQKINSTNAPGIPSTGVNGASAASRSKPRSNTKKDRTLPAKSDLKQVEAHSMMNKSNEKQKNRVDSTISYKRTIINSNSNTSCKTCNKCLISVNHDQCVVRSGMFVKQSPATKVWRVKQVKQVWKATGKLFTTIGHQWRPTGRLLPLGDQWPLTRNTPPKVLPTKQWKPTGRLLPLGRQCPLVRSTALKSDCMPADPQETIAPVAYNLACTNQPDPNCNWGSNVSKSPFSPLFKCRLYRLFSVGLNKTVRFVRTNNGTEFVNKDLTDYYESVGITHEKTVPRTPQQNGVVERRNRTLVEAARTMLIFSKAPLFLWAEAVATACYTQNRSLIHTLHNKTPYELVHDKKPDLSFLRIFGALCYPTNDSEDLGKLKAKADIGFFVGYAPNRKGYRIYNKRTRQIMETIHVTFDELTEQTAPVHSSPGPAHNLLTPGPISSGLVPNPPPAAPYVPPTNKELEILFQPMFDEYFETSTVDRLVPPAPAPQAPVNPTGPSVSIPIDQEAPSGSHSPSSSDHQSSLVHQGVAAEHSFEVNPFAADDPEPFVNVFAPDHNSEASSSRVIARTESNQTTQPHEHLRKWTASHPIDNIIRNL
ncbi:retrovirus-related pol polyprotein from transposon TNT 1-94 [Tanacetum coccineum]